MASFFSRLNPVPAFPAYAGPYKVGTVDVEIPTSELQDASKLYAPSPTIAFRCFYPCEPPAKPSQPVYWVQKPQRATISAYARFVGAGSGFSDVFSYFPQLLYHCQIPAHRNATLHQPQSKSNRWPVLIFSHGLGGSRNAYSHLCGTLASFGLVVVAPEHRDGSCPISYVRATENAPARTVGYQSYSHKPSPETYDGRDEQLRIRLWELSRVHEALRKLDAGDNITNLDTKASSGEKHNSTGVLGFFRDRLAIHEPGSIAFAGHSFGASTCMQFVKSIFYYPKTKTSILSFTPSTDLQKQVTATTPISLLDLWTLPLNSPSTATLNALPMPCYTPSQTASPPITTTPPLIAVLSSAFVNWRSNFEDVKRKLAPPPPSSSSSSTTITATTTTTPPTAQIFYPLKSAHLSQSDFGILFPRVTKYFAKAEEPERTLKLNTRAVLQMLRQRGVEVGGGDDARILGSKKGEEVRGWVAIGVGVGGDEVGVEEVRRVNGNVGDGDGDGDMHLREAEMGVSPELRESKLS